MDSDLASRGAGIGTHDELRAVLRRLGLTVDESTARYDAERRPFGTRIVARARRLGAYIEAQLKPPAERTEAERQPPPEVLMREIGSMAVDLRELTTEF